ncbi:MAG: lipid-binding SYLF domain-containing protein [Deltaproteobacteria bacterium]|nr:lipid-binding SYLF domain-containing protein [Deltaproteobacteria bacterium]
MKMKKTLCHLLMLNLFLGMLVTVPALYADEVRQVGRINECAEVLEEIMSIPENSIPAKLMRNCEAIAIFPSVVKAGLVIGGRGGKGVVVARDEWTGEWGAPSFYIISGGSIGFQIGVQVIDLILIIPKRRVLRGLVQDRFTLGTDAAVAAGPVGRNTELSTDILLRGAVLTYSRAKGLFVGVALKGSILEPDYEANKSYYGRHITPERILLSGKIKPPASARKLIKALNSNR